MSILGVCVLQSLTIKHFKIKTNKNQQKSTQNIIKYTQFTHCANNEVVFLIFSYSDVHKKRESMYKIHTFSIFHCINKLYLRACSAICVSTIISSPKSKSAKVAL